MLQIMRTIRCWSLHTPGGGPFQDRISAPLFMEPDTYSSLTGWRLRCAHRSRRQATLFSGRKLRPPWLFIEATTVMLSDQTATSMFRQSKQLFVCFRDYSRGLLEAGTISLDSGRNSTGLQLFGRAVPYRGKGPLHQGNSIFLGLVWRSVHCWSVQLKYTGMMRWYWTGVMSVRDNWWLPES